MKKSLLGRLLNGMGATAYGQAITLSVQLISAPILISFWGVEYYGVWLAISALPSFLSSSNLGIANAAASEMTIMSGRGNVGSTVELSKVYHTACALTLIMTSLVFLIISFVLFALPSNLDLFSQSVEVGTVKLTIFLLVLYILFTLYGGLWDAAFRSTGRFARGTLYLNTIRLVEETSLLLVVVFWSAELVLAAFTLLICRIAGTLIVARLLALTEPKLPFGLAYANMETFKRLLPASLGYMAMPLGYALFIQGVILIVASFSLTYVALFSMTRTLTSSGRQLVSIVSHASWPELSRAFGEGNLKRVKVLFWGGTGMMSVLLVAYLCLLGVFGDVVFELWIGMAVQFDHSLFLVLAVAAVAGSLWSQGYMLLASINKHMTFSVIFVISGILLLGLCYTLTLRGYGSLAILSVLPIIECILVVICFWFVFRLFKTVGESSHE